MRDLVSDVSIVPIIVASLDADNTPAALDLAGYNSAVVAIGVGIGGITFTGTNKVEFKLTHSDDNSTYTAVVAADVDIRLPDGTEGSVSDGGIVRSLIAAHAAATVTRVGYKGGKRYLKLLADFGGSHAAVTPLGCHLIKGHALTAPA